MFLTGRLKMSNVSVRIFRGALLAVTLCAAALPASAEHSKRLLSYYPPWAQYQDPPFTAQQIPYQKMTHILHAFLLLDTVNHGDLYVDRALSEPESIRKAHASGVKVMISIGGADAAQAAEFSNIADDDGLRRRFAHNVQVADA